MTSTAGSPGTVREPSSAPEDGGARGVADEGAAEAAVREETVGFASPAGSVPATLAGTLFRPAGTPARALVLHGATGVPHRYYARFARWLAATRDYVVLTYDYRDFGASATRHPRRSPATMADWGVHDQSAALDALHGRFPALPLDVIGHSLGGQYGSWHALARRVERMVTVGAGPAWWRAHPVGFMPKVLWFWFLGGPALVRAAGYLPGRAMGLGADLPAGVYRQWRRWCLSPRFHRDEWGLELPLPDLSAVRARLRIVGVEDDVFVVPARARMNGEFYPAASIEQRLLRPADHGLAAIGHLGAFAERCRPLWPELVPAAD